MEATEELPRTIRVAGLVVDLMGVLAVGEAGVFLIAALRGGGPGLLASVGIAGALGMVSGVLFGTAAGVRRGAGAWSWLALVLLAVWAVDRLMAAGASWERMLVAVVPGAGIGCLLSPSARCFRKLRSGCRDPSGCADALDQESA